ncbi:TrmB family transcriptional regulator [Salinigranum salinum]|uniref:TrmB family transcriptional regulator n=1 Tax=Salinigranum salinum TaxID=1364937 RepID=UPI001864CB47|nr:TrmB family transcriptional regulator [Salinigranum salinum]
MDELSNTQQAIELLQQLGLKEYEAKCFVALSQLPKGTAKDVSETSDVPRTRVYDAIRVLETKGLVEVQHSKPQQFRAVSIEEAAETLRREYEARAKRLTDVLQNLEPVEPVDREITHEVWSLTGFNAISTRTVELVGGADSEIVLIVGQPAVFTEELADSVQAAREAGVDVVIGTATEDLRDEIQQGLPDIDVFTSGLEWLASSPLDPKDGTTVSRLLLVDQNTILVSTALDGSTDGRGEKAVFGRGFENGLVVIARRMMATGLGRERDPDAST